MSITCFDCGETGHVARECPNVAYVRGDGSGWCGYCDERTRLVDLGDKVRRCPDCHPLRGQMLKQHRKCASCHAIVYVWDLAPCDQHQEVGRQFEYVDVAKPERPRDEDSLRALALQQAAEYRLSQRIIAP